MIQTVEGIYKDGRVELNERPEGVQEARVLVTFLPVETPRRERLLEYGKYAAQLIVDEGDFAQAEWREDVLLNEP